jgi:ABC-type bacteriocin/lantibiotic exporter with double-glycine peptidase domain
MGWSGSAWFGSLRLIVGDRLRVRIYVVLILMVAAAILEALSLAALIPLLSMAASKIDLQLGVENTWVIGILKDFFKNEVLGLFILLYVLNVLKYAFLTIFYWVQTRFVAEVQVGISTRLFQKYMFQPYEAHSETGPSAPMRNMTTEIDQFIGGALLQGMVLLTEVFVLTSILSLLMISRPLETLLAASIMTAAGYIFIKFFRKKSALWGNMRQVYEGDKVKWLHQAFYGIKDIRIFGAEPLFIKKFGESLLNSVKMGRNQNFIQNMPRVFVEFAVLNLIVGFILFGLSRGADIQEAAVAIGLFAAAAFRLMPSANRIVTSVQSIKYSQPAMKLLAEELSAKPTSARVTETSRLHFDKCIEIRNLTYKYKGRGGQVLRGIDLKIEKGSVVGIVGASGAGKTTLINLITGLIAPTEGSVYVDGVSIVGREGEWRQLIGYVPQNPFLLHGSIRDNIIFGRGDPEMHQDRLDKVIAEAHLNECSLQLNEEYGGTVGAYVNNISGGELQRLSIARALFGNPEVLVLDEATSSLDKATEEKIIEKLREIKLGKTIIIVTHRDSILSLCDAVYSLKDGGLFNE